MATLKLIKAIRIVLMLTALFLLMGCGGSTMGTAIFETNQGYFKIELFTEKMPVTTKNFIDLAEKGFYDNTKFHRVIANFMIQGGDPLSKNDAQKPFWGTGGPGYKIKDEFDEELSNGRGTLAMANAGPNTGGSQFFINTVDNTFLDGKHPVFGKVVEGMQIVDKISKVATDGQDKPVEDVIVLKVTIE